MHLARSVIRLLPALFVALLAATPIEAATHTVCAKGCMYTGLQQAIDAAQPGDRILLRAGETFIGNVKLRKKSGSGEIVIRSDAPDSELPGPGVRLVPSDRPGSNTSRSRLARLRGYGGSWRTTPVIRTEAGAANYRLMFLEIDGAAQEGYETLIALGNNRTQTSASLAPFNLTFDRVYVHGDPVRGQKRCLALDSGKTAILNSYFADCKHFSSEAQAIAGFNGPGPFQIINNYLEASTENILFGGADPKTPNLVPSDITIARNHFNKQLSWRKPILSAPTSPRVSASSTGGVLSARTHYFKVVAVLISGGTPAVSKPSAEVSVSLSGGATSASVSWAAVKNATRYRIYRGTSAGGENVYLETSGASTTFTYTGRNEKAGKPRTSGMLWNVKNLIELKNAQRVTIEGNIIEHVWTASQNGYAMVFTPRNQDEGAPWTVVQDVTVRNNIVRHVNSGINILGVDYSSSAGTKLTRRVKIQNNVFYDVGGEWGGSGRWIVITQGPEDIVVDHNTVFHDEHAVIADDGRSSGFVFTNNLLKHNRYGVLGAGTASGTDTLNTYFPGAVFKGNVLAGGKASMYPSGNYFPSVLEFLAQFVNYALGDCRLISTSPFIGKATDGKNIGADIGVLNAAQQNSAPPSTSNQAPTAAPGGPYTGVVGGTVTADGSGSRDSDGRIVTYHWGWGDKSPATYGVTSTHRYASAGTYTVTLIVTDEDGATDRKTTTATISAGSSSGGGTGAGDIVLTSRDVNVVRGRWTKKADSSAAGGQLMQSTEEGWWNAEAPLAEPRDYFEATFQPAAGTSYRVWLRLRANSRANDSVFVQFTGATDANGVPLWRTGTTKGLKVVLENCDHCGVSGWGWQKGAFWLSNVPLVRFEGTGPQTIRVQPREDGVQVDQIVLSPVKYVSTPPGAQTNDVTILPRTAATLKAGDIVLRSRDVIVRKGNWSLVDGSGAAGGTRLSSTDRGWATMKAPLADPSHYFDVSFAAVAGVQYRVWVRLGAQHNSGGNDSVWLQYSGARDGSGTALAPIGTTRGVLINGVECSTCSLSGWGWKDSAYWTPPGIVRFATTGTQKLRVQLREDGAQIDQIVISPERYLSKAPGASQKDRTWVRPDGTVTTY